MASDRLVRFAAAVNRGDTYKAAALGAGYAASTADHDVGSLIERARAAGLLVDPAVVQDAVAIIEAGLGDLAREIVRVGRGEAPHHDEQLAWIREAFDRTRGKPKQPSTVDGSVGMELRIVYGDPDGDAKRAAE